MKLSVSFLKSDYKKEETLRKIYDTNASFIHVDLMDGEYAGEDNINLERLDSLLWNSKKPLDIHLMVNKPLDLIKELVYLKPTYITVHADIDDDLDKIISYLKRKGIKVGIALNPEQDYKLIEDYLGKIDQLLIMTVVPGFGGQKFMLNMIPKIKKLNQIKKLNGYKYVLSCDGGINDQTIDFVKNQVDMVVSGSFICCSKNYQKQIDKLK